MSGSIVKSEDVQVSHGNTRQRRLRSVVWNDFTKEFKEDGSDIATCNHCKRKFTGASRSGTTHLRNHLRFCASYERAKRKKKLVVVRAQSSQLDAKNGDSAIVVHEEDTSLPIHGGDSFTEILEGDNPMPVAENVNNVQISQMTPSIRRRRLRSVVWNDFTKEQKEDGSLVAICNHCSKQMAGGSSSGTTHLKKHLANCMVYQRAKIGNVDIVNPLLTWVDKTNDPANNEHSHFDQNLIQQDLAHMIILHEYPFSIVNHIGFRSFVKDLQPQFILPSPNSLEENCIMIYKNKRCLLYELLNKNSSHITVAVDAWSLSADVGYLCLSSHFVDDDWKLQKKVINFWHVESPQESEGVSKLILEKLGEWNIDRKLFSLVTDSSSTSDKVVQELVQSLHSKQALLLDGKIFHVYSCPHILDLIVQAGLQVIADAVKKIRDSVKFVRSSHARLERFQAVSKQVGAPEKPVHVDDRSRWTSTFVMIETAYEFRDAFFRLAENDSEYVSALSSMEWDSVKSIAECLKVFHQMTEKASSNKSPTANHCFNNICGIHLSLRTWSNNSNPLVSTVASQMLEQFEKYWCVTSIIPVAASILDPRYKMKSVEYFFKLIYTDESEVEAKIDDVLHTLKNLFNEYALQVDKRSCCNNFTCKVSGSYDSCGTENRPNGVLRDSSHNPLADLQFGLDQYLQETSSCQPIKSDLDLYLEEAMHPLMKGHDDDFDILSWWKHNAVKYPILSEMARDILGVPLSIAFQDSSLTSRAKTLDHYHCSVNPATLQALICSQDWLRSDIEDSALEGSADGLSTFFTATNFDSDIKGYL